MRFPLTRARRRKPFRRVIAVLGLAGLLGVAGSGVAVATPVDFGVVVGLPVAAPGSDQGLLGQLDVRLRTGGTQLLDEEQLGIPQADPNGYARFGSVIAIRDLNGDGHDDLVVGAPGATGPAGPDAVGRVDLLFGSAAGISLSGATAIPQPQLTAGDRFGAALALSARGDNSGIVDLWVGAPDHEVNAEPQAGEIYRYAISPTGVPTLVERISQAAALVPGTPEAGDHFGAVMADDSANRIVVGVPDEDIGTIKDAGTVELLRTDQISNALIAGDEVSQNSKDVPGTAEAGDHFGAALTVGAHVVGVPGEDVGRLKDAGAVQTFGPGSTSCRSLTQLCPSKAFTQNSSRVPGQAEAGDRFGASVSEGIYRRVSYRCSIYPSTAIGSPGEDIGKIEDAGSVTTLMLPAFANPDDMRGCPPIVLRQGNGLPGTAEAGDQTGSTLSTIPGDQFDDVDQRDAIVTGVPGEDIGTIKDAGRVILGSGTAARTFGAQAGDVVGRRYGSVLARYQAIIPNF